MDGNRNNIWSLYFTLVISFIIFVLFGLIQSLISLFIGIDDFVVYLGLISIVSSILGCGMILLAVVTSKNTIQEYLNLYIPFSSPSLKYIFVFALLLLGLDSMSNAYPELFNDSFAIRVYESADSLLMLCLGFVLLGPLFEEFLFRGFLFKGLENSIGGNGAVIISSLLFSIPHLQYSLVVVLCMVFPMALFLGYVRMKTQSLVLPIIFHSINNFMTLLLVHLEVY